MDLGTTEQEIQLLNPTISIDRIYPEVPYNVTYRPSRSGKWTEGCPPSLRIPETSDPLILDPSNAGQEAPLSTSIAGATDIVGVDNDDENDDDNGGDGGGAADEHRLQNTHTIRKTVAARTSTTTTYGSDLSSTSMVSDSQSADESYPSFAKSSDIGNESEGYPTTGSVSDTSASAALNPTAPSSEDEETSLSHTERPGQVDASNTSGATQSTGAPEKTPTASQDTEAKPPTASEDAVSSYASVFEELAGASSLPDVSSTGAGSATTGPVTENERSLESTLAASSVPSSITGTTELETAPSSTLPQTGASHDNETEEPSGASSNEERTTLPEDHSTQVHSAGTEEVPTTSLTAIAATTTTASQAQKPTGSTTDSRSTDTSKDTSAETQFANTDTASDRAVSSTHTISTTTSAVAPSSDDSTKQVSTGAKSSREEIKTTFTTSTSTVDEEATSTVSPSVGDSMLSTECFDGGKPFGLGYLFGFGRSIAFGNLFPPDPRYDDMIQDMTKHFCGKSSIDNRMKAGDKCIQDFWQDRTSQVGYLFEICPRNNCPYYGQHMGHPLGQEGLSCTDIFMERIWRFCSKRDGGVWVTGCLEYKLKIG
ncbi:hypothetical protein FPOAC2_14567 [Fusarium poae]